MGKAVAEAAVSAGLQLVPVSFSSQATAGRTVQVGSKEIQIHGPSERDYVFASIIDEFPDLIVVDYTVPDAVNGKNKIFISFFLLFLMITGDPINCFAPFCSNSQSKILIVVS